MLELVLGLSGSCLLFFEVFCKSSFKLKGLSRAVVCWGGLGGVVQDSEAQVV